MISCRTSKHVRTYIGRSRTAGRPIGFIPTMGALHEGHLSLIERAQQQGGITVCSIFVNPTQFNDPVDFEKYPIHLEQDIYLLDKQGLDILFLPPVAQMYPEGLSTLERYDLGYLEKVLEGNSRPGHFQGVCQVMNRLLSIVQPDHLFMGQKDFQQCLVVRQLIERFYPQLAFHTCPTLRESDGLAMSSRNARLPAADRKRAAAIYQALCRLQERLRPGDLSGILDQARDFVQANGLRVDYVEIADAATLKLIKSWDGKEKIVALVAAYINGIRLIDNLLLNP
jgi:pantoate--beta-alanine ligase